MKALGVRASFEWGLLELGFFLPSTRPEVPVMIIMVGIAIASTVCYVRLPAAFSSLGRWDGDGAAISIILMI